MTQVFAGFVTVALILNGCATGGFDKDKADPKLLVEQTCGGDSPGAKIQEIKGSVWLKAQSKEASGQFPAMVIVKSSRDLHMEVTNLLGGTEAVISVKDRHYSVKVPSKKSKQEGTHSWGGIPLDWATELFLGRIPCPPIGALSEASASIQDGDLILETKPSLDREAEKFVYGFRKWEGRPWPDSLHWERKGTVASSVDFKFDEPEDGTRSPKKWEAKSSLGEVKVRWRDREMVR